MTGKLRCLASLTLLIACAALAKPAARTRVAMPPVAYASYSLRNGLKVIVSEDHRLPVVTVYVLYHVGPASERAGRTGFAHLFEHFMFDGSLHVGEKAHFKILEAVGAQQVNGTTDLDHTQYFETVPSNELETALWLESDRMGFLLDTLDAAKLANIRDVVRNELRQSIENQPYGLAEIELYHRLFPQAHPYHADVIGSHKDIEAANIADVRQFCKSYYVPNNATLTIVGDIDKAHVEELVEKYFAPLPAGPKVREAAVATPPIPSERRATITDTVDIPRLYMAWITPPIFALGNAEDSLLAQIVGGSGKTSRLYRRLVHEDLIAQDVRAEQTSLSLGSVFTVQATPKPGVTLDQLEAALDKEIATLQKEGPTQAELDGARNMIEARMLRSMETTGGETGVAGRLAVNDHYTGDPGFSSRLLQMYNRATVASVRLQARRQLGRNHRVLLACVPGPKVLQDVPRTKSEKASAAPRDAARNSFVALQKWREARPETANASTFHFPVAQQFQLSNGLTVNLMQRHDLPVATVSLFVLSGSEANPPEKPGLAAFVTATLMEGTHQRSAYQIAFDADLMGADLVARSIADWSGIQIRCLTQNLAGGFELISDLALHPKFNEEDVERVRLQQQASLLQEKSSPTRDALKVFYHLSYGDGHPYGFTENGSEQSAKTISTEDLVGFWKAGYTPRNSVLSIAGDVTEEQARTLAETYFKAWSDVASPERNRTGLAAPLKRKIAIVDKPGSSQTAILVGGFGISRVSPDYLATELMNNILGGLVSSRLSTNLRETHGYTYGIFSQFVYRRGPGPFFVRTSVRTDAVAPALTEIMSELTRISVSPLTQAELDDSKNSMVRSLPELFETTQQASRSIGDLFVYGLPLDYYRELPQRIQQVDLADVARVAKEHVQTGSMVIVLVGDRSKMEPEVRKLALAPIEVFDPEGVVRPSAPDAKH